MGLFVGLYQSVLTGEPVFALQHMFVALHSPQIVNDSNVDHRFDSDSFLIAVDNCSSRCITNDKRDFVGEPRKVHVLVKGIAGFGAATHVGTVRWSIQDDRGVVHEHLIPNTYLHESSPYRLLSPQHWSQEAKDGRGTWCATYFDAVELFWKQHQYVRTVYLDSATNVALIRSAPKFGSFNSFCAQVSEGDSDVLNEKEFMCMPTLVSDDEDSESEDDGSHSGSSNEGEG